jgi:hypothetical protein
VPAGNSRTKKVEHNLPVFLTTDIKVVWTPQQPWHDSEMIRVRLVMAGLPIVALALPAIGSGAMAGDIVDYVVPYGGVDVVQDSVFAYSGTIVALKHSATSHIMLQGFVGKGNFTYPSSIAPDGDVDGDATWLRGMVGYQTNVANLRFTGYVGLDWQDYELSPPDASNPTAGSEAGFFTSADFETIDPKPFYVGLMGQASTAYHWYWTRARAGYEFKKIVVGPEGIFFGNIGFDAQRAGGFVTIPIKLGQHGAFGLTLSGGYQWIGDDEDDGQVVGSIGGVSDSPYGSVNITAGFW